MYLFLPRDMLASSAALAVMRCLCVRLSVCPSRSWIVSKRMNTSSKLFHHRVAKPFLFFHTVTKVSDSSAKVTEELVQMVDDA